MLACDGMKHYPRCNEDKPLEAFGKSKCRADGLTVYCKACRNKAQRDKYHVDPALREHKAKTQRERMADPEKHEEQLERQRTWYREHWADPEWARKELARGRVYRATERGRGVGLKSSRKRRADHRKEVNRKHAAYVKKRYASDPEFKANVREWFRRRRNMKRGNGGEYEIDDWLFLVSMTKGRCPSCGKKRKLELDHVLPIAKGGSSNLSNIQPLCRSCNAAKGTETTDYRSPSMLQFIDLLH